MISLLFEHHILRFAFGYHNPNHAVAMICALLLLAGLMEIYLLSLIAMICFVLFVASHPSVHKNSCV